ncbi:MAG: DUF222 domain-containing protein [Micrococcales bacterium]|nr:DUF222 domain-containing protein [Micrococcales bacterium]
MAVLEVSRPAMRRTRIRQSLPTDHPPILDQIADLLNQLPDPLDLSSDQVVGAMTTTAELRNRFDAYLTDLAGTADATHISKSLRAGTTGMLVATATGANPATGSAIVGTARALRTLPHVAQAYRDGQISTPHVHALREAATRITDFTDLEPALVEMATTIEPIELRRILTLLIGQCQPDHDHTKQRDKRGLSLSETPNGMYRLDGWLDAIEGRRLRDTLTAFTDPGLPGDTRTPTQARADALADILAAANANTRPLGVSGLSRPRRPRHLPDGLGATLDDGHPIGPDTFDLLSCATACAVIFGAKRKDAFVPMAPRPRPPPRHPLAMGRPHRPRPRLHPLRTRAPLLPSPPHPALAPRRLNGPVKFVPALQSMSRRPPPRPLHHHHQHPRHTHHHQHPRTSGLTISGR